MVRKIIIIVMILLILPISFSVVEQSPPEKTNNEELCISVVTGREELIKFYIDSQQQKITLEDGREVDEIDASLGGKFTGCINLHPGENKVEVRYQYGNTEEFTVILDTEAPTLEGFDSIQDFVNTKKFTINIDEDATLTIVINGQIETIDVEAGNPEIELNLNEGENTVKIDIEDVLGNNETVLDKTITLDTKKPKVEIISVDDTEYSQEIDADFQIVEIKGKTDLGILKIFNLFENVTYYYDKDEDKFLKSKNGEEITVKSEQLVELSDEGNFEDYVHLLPGKNRIVFLATDQANNKNTKAQDINNVGPALLINFEGAEHWNIVAKPMSKLKALNILGEGAQTTFEIRFSPRNIDPERLNDVRISRIYTPNDTVGDNELIRISGQPASPYYNKEKNEFITHQNIVIQWPGSVETAPRQIKSFLKGKIQFYVGDPGKTSPLTEEISLDLLFYVETIEGKYLNPKRMKDMSKALEDSLKGIRKTVKTLQKVAIYDALGCAIAKIWNNVIRRMLPPDFRASVGEKYAEYLICDRIICYDTPPTSKSVPLGPDLGITYYTKGRSPDPVTGDDYFHETACPENMLRSETNPYAPVRVREDLYQSTRCACLPGVWLHLQHIYATLAAVQGCLDEAMKGTTDPAECEVKIAQASCSLSFWSIEKFLLDKSKYNFYDYSYFYRTGGTIFSDIKSIWDIRKLPEQLNIKQGALTGLNYWYKKEAYKKACTVLASADWGRLGELGVTTAREAIPSYGKAIVKSEIVENGDLMIKYYVTPIIAAGTHPVRWNIKFDCDNEGDNRYTYLLCKNYEPRYATNLAAIGMLHNRNTPAGITFQEIIEVPDTTLDYWFNKVELELTYFVTTLQREVTYKIKSDIDSGDKDEIIDKLYELCVHRDDYKHYGICERFGSGPG